MTRSILRAAGLACMVAAAFIGCKSSSQGDNTSRPDFGSLKSIEPASEVEAIDSDRAILATTHLAAGNLFEQQKQFEKAVWQYQLALKQDPRNPAAHNRLAICLNQLGQFQQAEQCFKQALALEPGSAYLKNNLGFNLMLQKRWLEAEQWIRAAVEARPGYRRARINLGVVLGKQGRFDEAFNEFRPVIGDALAYYNLGMMYRASKNYTHSAAAFDRALALEPRLVRAQQNLAELAVLLGKSDPDQLPETHQAQIEPAGVAADLQAHADQVVAFENVELLDAPPPDEDDLHPIPENMEAQPSAPVVELQPAQDELPAVEVVLSAAPQNEPDEPEPTASVSISGDPDADNMPEAPAEVVAVQEDPFDFVVPPVTPPAAPSFDRRSLLDNEPCEARAIADLVESLQDAMQPCREREVVDQFVFRLADPVRPQTTDVAEVRPSPADHLAGHTTAQHLESRPQSQLPWQAGEINFSDVQGFRLPEVNKARSTSP